ncbi:MAG: rhodanese-like domain-containing protein [Mycobacteriaceae bacterium]
MTNTQAVEYFSAKLAYETDVSDVAATLKNKPHDYTLVDTRSIGSWKQGRIPGSLHIPTISLKNSDLPSSNKMVVYCWGPGCNGASKAALILAQRGFAVQEMIGGFEYWVREGFPIETDNGMIQPSIDPLTAVQQNSCDC